MSPGAARLIALADECVLCGLCLPHCPTYGLDRNEAESPRGRIMLMKGLAEGRLAPEPVASEHLDHCLACRACERVCPAQVRYGELLALGREQQRASQAAGWRQRAMEWLLLRPRLRDAAFAALRRLDALLPRTLLPLPIPPPKRTHASHHPAQGQARGAVALFAGCLGGHYDANAISAAIRVLNRLGWDVLIPPAQQCCGSLHHHAGASAAAATLAEINRNAFASFEASAILTLASGCHERIAATLHTEPGPPVRDLCEFLAQDSAMQSLSLRPARAGLRVAVHLPCTQRNVSRSAMHVAPLLARIPDIRLESLPATGCCGAAGSHMVIEPERAQRLRAPLLDAAVTQQATVVCSANVGCRMHLAAGIESCGLAILLQHPVELIAEHLE